MGVIESPLDKYCRGLLLYSILFLNYTWKKAPVVEVAKSARICTSSSDKWPLGL